MEVLDRTYSIFVNDKLRGWRADGKAFPTHLRTEGDGDDDEALVAALDEEGVLALLAARSLAKKDGEYERAVVLWWVVAPRACLVVHVHAQTPEFRLRQGRNDINVIINEKKRACARDLPSLRRSPLPHRPRQIVETA